MLIFFHIPKTAGTTFLEILEREYKNKAFTIDGVNWEDSLKVINSWSEKEIRQHDLIKGHYSYSLKRHSSNVIKNASYISFFRDPISLFLSTYSYVKIAKLNRYHEIIQNMTLEDWVKFRKDEKLDNLQSRHLLERLPIFNPFNEDLDIAEKNKEQLESEIINRLKTIDFKFTTSNFDKALLFLAENLKWKKQPYYRRKNTSNSDKIENIPPHLIEEIERMNWLDQFLYEQVQQSEKEKLLQITDSHVSKFQKKNKGNILTKLLTR